MAGTGSGLVLKLDFGDAPTTMTSTARGRAGLRLAVPGGDTTGPAKYRALALRRRTAQIRARHLLDQAEPEAWQAPRGTGTHGLRGGQ
jgi:hypothetical protein